MKRTMFCIFIAAAMPMLASAGEAISERTPFPAEGLVKVVNISGLIDVTGWDENEVELTGDLGSGSELTFNVRGEQLLVEVNADGGGRYRGPAPSSLRLRVPRSASLDLAAVSADITVDGSEGVNVRAESVSGDVDVRAATQRLDLSSVSGDVDFRGSSERSSVESVSGDLSIDGASGDLVVSVVSGDVELRGGDFRLGRFESVSGSLDLTLGLENDGRLTVESMSGGVTVNFPRAQTGDFRVQTFSGDIRSDFGSSQKASRGPGTRLVHAEGDGTATIRIENFSGDVRLNRD